MTEPTPDERHEARLRSEIGSPASDNPAWGPDHNYHASEMAFLLRRLDQARTAHQKALIAEIERRLAAEAKIIGLKRVIRGAWEASDAQATPG